MGLLILARRRLDEVIITVPPSDKETVIRVVPVASWEYAYNAMTFRCGFEAPRDTMILRRELWDGVKQGISLFQCNTAGDAETGADASVPIVDAGKQQ